MHEQLLSLLEAQRTEKLLQVYILQVNHKIHMEIQRAVNSQNNPEKGQSWKTHTSQFQTLPQSYSNLVRVVLS